MKKLSLYIYTALLFGLLLYNKAQASELFGVIGQEHVYENQSVTVSWYLNSQEQPINSLDLKLSYSTNSLKLTQTTAGNSIVSLWVKNPVSENPGQISLTGGVPGGITGEKLPIFTSTFQTLKPGIGSIKLSPESTVLLSDGRGTPDVLTFQNLEFIIEPQANQGTQVTSTTHPDQATWYKNNNLELSFTPDPQKQYSYSLSSNPEMLPDDKAIITNGQIKYQNLPDGVYFFKLNSKTSTTDWKQDSIYRAQIDSTAPETFTPIISSDTSIFNNHKFVSFATVDKTSGVAYYRVKQGLFGQFHNAQSPYELSKPLVGDNLTIEAVDFAGNIQTANLIYKGYLSVKAFIILCLILLCAIFLLLYRYRKNWFRNKNA